MKSTKFIAIVLTAIAILHAVFQREETVVPEPLPVLECIEKNLPDPIKPSWSPWDSFRIATMDLACRMNREFKFGMSDIRLYDALMKTFFAECKFKVGKAAINSKSDARGIIQWMPGLRRKLNVPENIHEIPLKNQLPYVYEYFKYKVDRHNMDTSKIDEFVDIYCIVFAPAYADRELWHAMYSKPTKAYLYNQGYDYNDDGKITKWEVNHYILNKHYS